MTTNPLGLELIQAFELMEVAMQRFKLSCLSSFGRGHEIHNVARAVAPEWLRRWDDDKRWCICFTQGHRGLISMASAFGLSEEELLLSMKPYFDS